MQNIKQVMAYRKGLVVGFTTGSLGAAFIIFYLFI